MMVTRAQVRPDDVVLILGASGGVGTACVLLAKLVGATVIACANNPDKLRRLRELGADHVVNYAEQSMREAVWEIVGKPRVTGTGGVDLVVNCTGRGTWIDSLRCMKVGARLVTCGATAGFEEQIDIRYVWTFEHNLLGSNGWRRSDITRVDRPRRAGHLAARHRSSHGARRGPRGRALDGSPGGVRQDRAGAVTSAAWTRGARTAFRR